MKSLQEAASFITPQQEWDASLMDGRCLCDTLHPADVSAALALQAELEEERKRSARRRHQLTKLFRDRDILRAQLKDLLTENSDLRRQREETLHAR